MEEQEQEICPHCNGSAEGMFDGTVCSVCKGSGVEENFDEDFDEPEEDYDLEW